MENVLNKSRNYFKATGYVYEKASVEKGKGRVPMHIESCEVALRKDGKLTGEKVKAQRLNGVVSLRTDEGIMDFKLFFTSIKSNGEPSKNWEMAEKILEWNSVIGGDGEQPADYVTISGSVAGYDYISTKTNKPVAKLQYNASTAKHADADIDPSGVTLTGTAFVKSIVPEIKNEEETGRVLANCFVSDGTGKVFPLVLIGDEGDAAEFLTDEISVGDTIGFDANRIMRHVGGVKKATRKVFGKSSQDMTSGYDKEELQLVAAEIVEEPELTEDDEGNVVEDKSGWLNPQSMKKALKERDNMLAELANNSTNNKANNSFNEDEDEDEPASVRKPAKKSPKATTNNNPFDDDDDGELPF